MKNLPGSDNVRERPIPSLLSRLFKIRKEQTTDSEGRSKPLTSDYNSTFIVLVLSIAVILAVILLVWPSGGF